MEVGFCASGVGYWSGVVRLGGLDELGCCRLVVGGWKLVVDMLIEVVEFEVAGWYLCFDVFFCELKTECVLSGGGGGWGGGFGYWMGMGMGMGMGEGMGVGMGMGVGVGGGSRMKNRIRGGRNSRGDIRGKRSSMYSNSDRKIQRILIV